MKKKVIWLVVSCLMVAALVLAACAPAAPTEVAPTPEKEVTPTPEKEVAPTPKAEVAPAGKPVYKTVYGLTPEVDSEVPKYGGTLNFGLPNPSQGFDDALVQAWWALSSILTNDYMLQNDLTVSFRGTGELSYQLDTMAPIPSPFRTAPSIALSWEFNDPTTMVFHIRKGIHFALNPNSEASRLVGGREITVQDVAFNLNRNLKSRLPQAQPYGKWFRSATVDGDKVIVKGEVGPGAPAIQAIGLTQRVFIYPPEVIQKYGDMVDWRNSVGSGPFMLVDYVSGSAHTFARNPDYWRIDDAGPGKGMPLPYVDTVKWLDLRDVATRTAAFRTAKVDAEIEAEKIDADSLIKDNPKLLYIKIPQGIPYAHIFGRIDTKPFDDVRVRRALALAVDNQALADTLYLGDAEVYPYGKIPGGGDRFGYLPWEELPREAQMLFEYHPEEAKRLLVEAGYPDGFKTNIILPAYPEQIDMLSMYKAYWAKIGVDLTLDPREYGVFNSIRQALSHPAMMINRTGPAGGRDHFVSFMGKVQQNMGVVDDPYINERYDKVWSWELKDNDAERLRLWKEVRLYVLENVYIIEPPIAYKYRLWWPWLKNYHGEYNNYWKWAEFIWIDQELKKAMGFK